MGPAAQQPNHLHLLKPFPIHHPLSVHSASKWTTVIHHHVLPTATSFINPQRHGILHNSLGYAIAIAFGFLVLFSSLLLASYICFRHRSQIRNPNAVGGLDNGVILPSISFVEEENNENQNFVVGLDQSVINSHPKFPFSIGIPKGVDSVCAICLCEYREAKMMKMLPDF